MFSKSCEYGIKAAIHINLCSQEGKRASLKEVAEAIDSPVAFTAKILQAMAKHGVIASIKGSTGGYEIQNGNALKLAEIVQAIDGDGIYNGCGLGLQNCNDISPCPIHFQFAAVRDELKKMLMTTTINQLSHELTEGPAVLRR